MKPLLVYFVKITLAADIHLYPVWFDTLLQGYLCGCATSAHCPLACHPDRSFKSAIGTILVFPGCSWLAIYSRVAQTISEIVVQTDVTGGCVLIIVPTTLDTGFQDPEDHDIRTEASRGWRRRQDLSLR
jgi:hypothetical protein